MIKVWQEGEWRPPQQKTEHRCPVCRGWCAVEVTHANFESLMRVVDHSDNNDHCSGSLMIVERGSDADNCQLL